MNHSVLARDPFGMDSSLLDSSRSSIGHGRRQQGNGQGMDEDAPPTRSVNDLEEEMFGKAGEGRTKQVRILSHPVLSYSVEQLLIHKTRVGI